MAAANYEQIVRSIKQGKTATITLLMGDESYYIDKLATLFEHTVMPEAERDFNQSVLYGNDTDVQALVAETMRFPMMSERVLVILREAQMMDKLERFESYVEQIPETTSLLICYKGKLKKTTKLYKSIDKHGIVFETNKVPDYKVPDLITFMAQGRGMMIDPRSAALLAEFLGNDLDRIDSELEKIAIALPANDRVITADIIQKYIGISKEYNNFELLRAVVQKNAARAFQIAFHFAKNEKNNPIQPTLSVLFNYFSNLIALYYLPQVDERNIMTTLQLKGAFQARDYMTGFRNYKALQTYNILHQIRMTDAASKGVDSSVPSGELLKELLCFILS